MTAADGLDGQRILVTGGAGDIGAAIGATLLARGVRVTLADVKPRSAAAELLAGLPGVDYHELDVRSHADTRALLDGLAPFDAVVGAHGTVRSAPFVEIRPEDWQAQLDVNLTGCFNLVQATARRWIDAGRAGAMVLIGSWVGEVPWPEIAAYSASKAGVQMLARSAARELASHGIRVNVVAPGIVDAGMARHQRLTEPQYAKRAALVLPLGRLQRADEVADVTAFLCSSAASYITGSTLLADGGASLFQFDGGED